MEKPWLSKIFITYKPRTIEKWDGIYNYTLAILGKKVGVIETCYALNFLQTNLRLILIKPPRSIH